MGTQDSYDRAFGLHKAGDFSGAEAGYRAILTRDPQYVGAIRGLAEVAYRLGRNTEAIEIISAAMTALPNEPSILLTQGIILAHEGRFEDAITAYLGVLKLLPNSAEAYTRLATALLATGRAIDAIDACRRSLAIRPDHMPAIAVLCSALSGTGDLDEVIALSRAALTRHPEYRSLFVNLGWALREQGRLDEAISCYRQALAVGPHKQIHDDLLFTLHFHPDYGRRRLLEEHLKWAEIYANLLQTPNRVYLSDTSPDRPLRVGYVAHDLGNNPLGRFLLPLLANRDRVGFEVICYCDRRRSDEVGDRLASEVDVWRSTGALNDARVAELIREDRIDVLVDLTMHSNGSRLLAFAPKPAPVQVTYLAYCSTTGLNTIDYRFTDRFLDPPAEVGALDDVDSLYSERSIRLPDGYWCYPAPSEAPEVSRLPASINGLVTFGCLNEYSKVTAGVWAAWCALLREVKDSRLILHAKPGSQRNIARQHLAEHGIDPRRIEFVGRLSLADYFAQYNRIDIALDPFPYAGGTTTFDALWMGVPVITLAGRTAVGRGGVSILSNLGLTELISRTPEEYVRSAVTLSFDLPRLDFLRGTLRKRVSASPLTDGRRFAGDIEAAYRRMWRTWCEGR